MINKILKINIILIFIASILFAEIVDDFKIDGNIRVSDETIKIFSEINKGDDLNSKDLNNTLRKLYDTNFFKDITLNLLDGQLVINVIENPIIQSIEFKGIKANKIVEILKQSITLKEKSSFIRNYLDNDIRSISNTLKQSGYYFVKVEPVKIINDNNTIDLIYEIDLGEKALIKQIKFIGDKKFKTRKLRNIIVSEESKFWKFISNKKYLNQNRIELDRRLLESFYKNEGYYQVTINETSAKFIDESFFALTYLIDAGPKFSFNEFKLNVPDNYNLKNFSKIINIFDDLKDKKYSFKKIEKILDEIDKVALQEQYEFINASVEEIVVGKNKINFFITIEESEKVYVQRINILGNNITREEVLRNALIVDEGDAFNEILHNKSINALKGMGIFKKVESQIIDGDTQNQKIINISIEEKPTGEISLGAGVGTSGGTMGFSVKENNFMGKGLKVETTLNLSADTVRGVFSIYNPNFNYTDNSLSASIQSQVTDKMKDFGYKSSLTGFNIGTTYEQYDDFYFSPSISSFIETVDTSSTASAAKKKQDGSYFDTFFSYGLIYDKRNQIFQPTDGFKSSFSQSLPILSDDNAIIHSYDFNTYQEFSKSMVGSIGFSTKAVNSLSGDDVRVSKRVYIPNSKLRGFTAGRVGPKEDGAYIGGNYYTTLNFATTIPSLLKDFQDTDFKIFYDVANIWGVDYSSAIDNSNNIRSSVGVSVDWYTVIGPLNFSLSQPITKKSTDETETFRFQLGTSF